MITKRSVCPHDCPDTCGLMVGVEDGRIVSVTGDPDHPFTRGAVCTKMRYYPRRLYSPLRVLHPLKRNGPRGSGRFERITWDQALDEIKERYRSIIDEFGAEAILPYSYAGTMGLVNFHGGHAFFHKLGASKLLRTICSAAADAGFAASLGAMPTTDIETTVHADLIVIWGSNTLTTNLHAWPFFTRARKNGARIVVIDPYRNRTARRADRHLMLKPGTDAALALGLMHVLIDENLVDHAFIAEHTLGYDRLLERVKDYPLSRVEDITGVPAAQIEELALEFGRADAPYIRTGWGPARQPNGGMALRTMALLPALVGSTRKKGGGITRGTEVTSAFNLQALVREDLAPPNVRTVNMVALGDALGPGTNPLVRALHVYHSNPAVVAPESKKVLKGLSREDLFVVVHEHVLTETALTADIVLPAATALESVDLYRSYGHYYLQMAEPVIPPLGECRPTIEIFQDLGRRFGFPESVFRADVRGLIREILKSDHPLLQGISYEKLAEGRPVRVNVPDNPFAGGFNTPSGKAEFYSETMAGLGLDPLPSGEPGIDEAGRGRYPLRLITPPQHYFLNSTFNEVPELMDRAGRPTIMIHPLDAEGRDIEEGETVRVFNDRGECYLYADITEDTPPGLVVVEGLYWPRFAPMYRGVNQLTSQGLTDMGASFAPHCGLVEVESAV